MLDQLLDEIIEREGGAKDTDNPADSGGRTKWGISEKAHPEAWKTGPPSREVAKTIYLQQYLVGPNIHRLQPAYLRDQVADFAVMSGPSTAIETLQKVLGVPADGVLGPQTFGAVSDRVPEQVNNQLAVARALLYARVVQRRPKDLEFVVGWLKRALSFIR